MNSVCPTAAVASSGESSLTPLLDVTQSLRVAASFALMNNPAEGYVFAFGMPHPQGSISHVVDQRLVLVKLQNVCPPEALRPHYQEGYLVGRLPVTASKEQGDNVAIRMIGRYRLDNSAGEFWSSDFQPIPKDALLPVNDPLEARLRGIVAAIP